MKTEKFLGKDNIIAVVGATINKEKWGYKVYKALKRAFPVVYAVNPKYKEIEKDKCYPGLKSLPEKPDVVITVVPPKITGTVVKVCRELGISKVWMQPGSESKKAVGFCKKNMIEVVYNACFVVDGLKTKFFK